MEDFSFTSKVAIITGAGQGIGFEIGKQLCDRGAKIILNDIDAKLAIDAAHGINEGKDQCTPIAGDSGNIDLIGKMVDTAVEKYGRLDIVIANSGITLFGDFLEYPVDSFNRVMNVNLCGSFYLAQKGAKQMIKQQSGGSILFMSSVTGHQAHKQLAAYGMTKAALEMLAKNLVIELSQFRITVNTIAPGATLTERTLDDATYESIWSDITPMGRPAKTIDIANAALFMVSDKARHITGQSLIIDGGWTSVSPSPF